MTLPLGLRLSPYWRLLAGCFAITAMPLADTPICYIYALATLILLLIEPSSSPLKNYDIRVDSIAATLRRHCADIRHADFADAAILPNISAITDILISLTLSQDTYT